MAVARYNLDGSPDTSFGTGGRTIAIDMVGYMDGWKMASQGDGSIVVAGDYSSQAGGPRDMMLVRFTPAGLLDAGFGNGGIVRYRLRGTREHTNRSRSSPVTTRSSYRAIASSALVARFTSNGVIDTGFGNGGVATLGVSGSVYYDVALQTDGKVVAVGSAQDQFLIARYLGDPAPLQLSSAAPRGTTVRSLASSLSDGSLLTPISAPPLSPGQQETLSLSPLMPSTDQILTSLATDLIRSGKKRPRPLLGR